MDRDNKPKPIRYAVRKERIVRSAPDEPLTPGLRKTSNATAIGFVHDFQEPSSPDED